MKTHEIKNVEFWKGVIADLREQAKYAKTLKVKVNLTRALNDARGWLKYAESKILVVLALTIIVIACSSCAKMLAGTGQILDGFGDGMSYVGQHIQESVKE